jgi:MerR family transcriptional regulator, light-induced transcriptional regulator
VTTSTGPEIGAGLPIHEVSRLLGVPAPTLRAWELRYGIPVAPRSAGGHRRYSVEALQQVRLMRDEIARGRRAGEAAREVLAVMAATGPTHDLVGAVLAASAQMDPSAVVGALDRAVDELGMPTAMDEVLLPAMRQVGQWWETGRCDVAQEHLTSEAARGWLSRLAAFAPVPVRAKPAVLACGPRDLHTLGLEAMAVLLGYDGWSCRVLGARTPADTLAIAVRATSAAVVVVVSHLSVGRRPAVEAIRAVANSGTPVFYAGNAFLFARAREHVPGTYLGESLAAATELLSVIPSPGRRSRRVPSQPR